MLGKQFPVSVKSKCFSGPASAITSRLILAIGSTHNSYNLPSLFGIDNVPRDTPTREILDGHSLLSIDGTGHFCSSKVQCEHCLQRKSGKIIQYHHAAVAAVITHPETREVIPLAVEPIVKQDGETKNDCERNATAKLLMFLAFMVDQLQLACCFRLGLPVRQTPGIRSRG